MEDGIKQMEAVGARNEWRFTSTRWQELYSLSDFFNSLLCLLHSLSDLTLSGLNVKILGNFFSKCGWFLAEQPLALRIYELNTTLTEKEKLPFLPFYHFNNLPSKIWNVSMILQVWPNHSHWSYWTDEWEMTRATPNYTPAVSSYLVSDSWPVPTLPTTNQLMTLSSAHPTW